MLKTVFCKRVTNYNSNYITNYPHAQGKSVLLGENMHNKKAGGKPAFYK